MYVRILFHDSYRKKHIHTYILEYTYVHTSILIFTHIRTYECTYTYVCIYKHIQVHLHIRTHTPWREGPKGNCIYIYMQNHVYVERRFISMNSARRAENANTEVHAQVRTYVRTCTNTGMHAQLQKCMHKYRSACANTEVHAQVQKCMHKYVRTYVQKCMNNTSVCMYMCMHK